MRASSYIKLLIFSWKLSSLDDSLLSAHVGRFVGCESQPVI